MTINLSKGQKIDLAKEAPGMTNVTVGLGWEANKTDTGSAYDLDATVFMLDANEKLVSDKHMVFYNNLSSPDNAVESKGDNRTGSGEGDDETIKVDLSAISPEVHQLVFVVTIHEAAERNQNFGQVRNAYIKLVNDSSSEEVAKFELDEDFSTETAVQFGALYRKNDTWRFQAVGQGYSAGLQNFVNQYTQS